MNKQEYLANAGVDLGGGLSLFGTVGLLAERHEFVAGEDRERAVWPSTSVRRALSIGSASATATSTAAPG